MLTIRFSKTDEYRELKEKFDIVEQCLNQDQYNIKQIILARDFDDKLKKWLRSIGIVVMTKKTDFLDTGHISILVWDNSLLLKSEHKKLTVALECFDFFGK
jgi:hypothetical protein